MKEFQHGGDTFSVPHLRHDYSVNLSPLGMPAEVAQAIANNAACLGAYPDPDCALLCAAIAEKHGVSPENVLCGNGAADLIIRLALALKPKTVLTLAPGFSEYEKAAQLCGARFKVHTLSPEDDFRLSPAVLDDISPDTGLVFLCNPNNPTGLLAPNELMLKILEKCEQVGAVLAVDECFLEFTDAPSMTAFLKSKALVVINALTKTYAMAGLRLGYMLTENRELMFRTAAFSQSWSVSSAAQVAGLAALGCKNHISRAKALLDEERPYLSGGLKALGLCVFPSDAGFLLCKSPVPISEKLLERGILVRAASNFRGLDERYFRVCVSTRELNDLLLDEIREVLNG